MHHTIKGHTMKTTLIAAIIAIITIISIIFYPFKGEDRVIRIGLIPWPGYDFLHLANDKGFFEEEGIKVEIIEQASTVNQFVALQNNQISIASITLNELIDNNLHWKKPITGVLILDYSFGGDVILGQKEIKTMADLRGKKIALEDSHLAKYILHRALEKHDMTIKDVKIVINGLETGIKSMQNHTVDALISFPPYTTELKRSLEVNNLFDSTEIPKEIIDTLAVTHELLNNHPDIIKKIIRGWEKALNYSKENPKEAYAIMAKHEAMTIEEFESALSVMHIPNMKEQREIFKSKQLEHTIDLILSIMLSEDSKNKAPLAKSFMNGDILLSMDE